MTQMNDERLLVLDEGWQSHFGSSRSADDHVQSYRYKLQEEMGKASAKVHVN